MTSNPLTETPLFDILRQDGFIIFISGKKGSGKTNLSMLLMEVCHAYKLRTNFATNIHTESYFVKQITNYPDLKQWLEQDQGKKLYVLDEAGKHIKKLRFMSDQNTKFFELLQLIRHYDAGFIGIAPSEKFIDSNFLNTDILDAHIRKLSLTVAKVHDSNINESYFLNDLPKSSIIHKSKDIADFTMEKKQALTELPLCCQLAHLYVSTPNMKDIGKAYGLEAQEVKREIIKHIRHTTVNSSQATHEVKTNMKEAADS